MFPLNMYYKIKTIENKKINLKKKKHTCLISEYQESNKNNKNTKVLKLNITHQDYVTEGFLEALSTDEDSSIDIVKYHELIKHAHVNFIEVESNVGSEHMLFV